jgi:negative regulator of sigma E activity
VQTPDDEQFEHYLKQFRPLAAEPLPIARPKRPTVRWFVPVAVAAAGAVIMVVVVLGLHSRPKPTPATDAVDSFARIELLRNSEPLTIRSANALLASAPSFKEAVDRVAFQFQVTPLSKDTHSALAALSQEETKR